MSDSRSLNQHQLLSPAESDFLLASLEPTLTWFWWSQRAHTVPPPPAKGVRGGWQDMSPDTGWIHFFPSPNSVAVYWSTEEGFFTPEFGKEAALGVCWPFSRHHCWLLGTSGYWVLFLGLTSYSRFLPQKLLRGGCLHYQDAGDRRDTHLEH